MKTKLLGTALFALTATAIILLPLRQSTGAIQPAITQPVIATEQAAAVEVVFVLDTTGSMSGLIEAAKEKIWSIASSLAQAENAPEIRLGLVAFRDRGDQYVTRVTALSSDLDSVYATLMDYRAGGGGDTPESVNKALDDALQQIDWSQQQNTYQAIFLVGDAPPHTDYQGEAGYPEILAEAKRKGIRVNTIQAGNAGATTREWRRIAALGAGQYFQVDTGGNAVAIATPYDDRLAKLSRSLDETRLYYGDSKTRAEKAGKVAATHKLHESASVASRARRATFNASKSGDSNLLGDNELVDAVSRGDLDLATLSKEELPAPLQAMAPGEAEKKVKAMAGERRKLRTEIRQLAERRGAYLKEQVEKDGGAKASLDARIYGAVREQAAAKGFKYEAEAPAY